MAQSDNSTQDENRVDLQSWAKPVALIIVALGVFVACVIVATSVGEINFDASASREDAMGWLFTLVALLISGVYVFTTFRIDRGVKTAAREAAEKELKKFIKKEFDEWFLDFKESSESRLQRWHAETKKVHRIWMAETKEEYHSWKTNTQEEQQTWMAKAREEYDAWATKAQNEHGTWMTKFRNDAEDRLKDGLDVIDQSVKEATAKAAGVEPVDNLEALIAKAVNDEYERRSWFKHFFSRRSDDGPQPSSDKDEG